MREEERGVGREVRLDLLGVDLRLHLVGKQQRDELRAGYGVGNRPGGEPRVLGERPRLAALAEPDLDLDAGVVQVQRVGVPLAAVADHGHLAGEQGDVAVAEDLSHGSFLSCSVTYCRTVRRRRRACLAVEARGRPTRPVRTSSLIPCGRTSSSNDSSSSG